MSNQTSLVFVFSSIIHMYHVLRGGECEASPSAVHLLQFDGGSRGNPGVAGSGCVIYCGPAVTSSAWLSESVFVGHATNNVAEYTGLLAGLRMAAAAGVKHILIEGDSKLVVDQVRGAWKVNNARLKELHTAVLNALKAFKYAAIRHIRRSANAAADREANKAMDSRASTGTGFAPENAELFGNLNYII